MLFRICVGLSFGLVCGGTAGVVWKLVRKREYTEKQKARGRRLWKTGSRVLTCLTCLFLALGFLWCSYFLVLGAVHPEQAEYADNMSEMIASVLTVVSIAFAFYEFIRRKN